MKQFTLKINGRDAIFTTKSLTMEGKEYLYAHMDNIKHSASKHVYVFDYEGETKYLLYNEKDTKPLRVVFTQVVKMREKQRAKAKEEADKAILEHTSTMDTYDAIRFRAAVDEAAKAGKTSISEPVQPAPEVKAEAPVNDAEAPAPEAEIVQEAPEVVEVSDEVRPEVQEAGKEALKKESKKVKKKEANEEKQSRVKKSVVIFVAILVVLAILAVGWYFLFGPADNPNIGPNSDQTQQYDDIDDLIQDLEE